MIKDVHSPFDKLPLDTSILEDQVLSNMHHPIFFAKKLIGDLDDHWTFTLHEVNMCSCEKKYQNCRSIWTIMNILITEGSIFDNLDTIIYLY